MKIPSITLIPSMVSIPSHISKSSAINIASHTRNMSFCKHSLLSFKNKLVNCRRIK